MFPVKSIHTLRFALLASPCTKVSELTSLIQPEKIHIECFYTVDTFQYAFVRNGYNVVALDWASGSIATGLEVLHWIRVTQTSNLPVIFVSARPRTKDIIAVLQAGADDFLITPIGRKELLARLCALAHRQSLPESKTLLCPPYTLNSLTRHVTINGRSINLTEKEFDLAWFFFQHRGQLMSRQQLLRSVWRIAAELNTRTVDTHASRLRNKLQLANSNRWNLTSIYRRGYRLDEYTEGHRAKISTV